MTTQQIQLVQESFALVAADADGAAGVFYNRLFALDASLELMFPADLSQQKRKLMTTLKFAVETLDRFDVFETALENLGRKHAGYGVRDEHYGLVGTALIETLREGLKNQCRVNSPPLGRTSEHRRLTQTGLCDGFSFDQ